MTHAMKIETVNGDLIDLFKKGHFDGIAHGCNCFHAMNSGIAKTIREEFPEAHKADNFTKYGDYYKLGSMSYANVLYGTIFNLYTQNRPGQQHDLQRLYDDIELACLRLDRRIRYIIERSEAGMTSYKLGLPKIGAGIAGGDWDVIKEIISKSFTVPQVTVVNFVPGHVDLFDLA